MKNHNPVNGHAMTGQQLSPPGKAGQQLGHKKSGPQLEPLDQSGHQSEHSAKSGHHLEPLEKTDSHGHRLLHLKRNLKLEDRGGFRRNVFDKNKNSPCTNDISGYNTTFDKTNRFNKVRWCFTSVKRLLLVVLLVIVSEARVCSARNFQGQVPVYETAYACEGKTLKIGCAEGDVIHLIRANYGRFSITICNDHGNTDWSVNCMSTRSLRVLHNRCSMHQNCSILASTNMFGDPCPNTLKYLEAHYQCVPASPTSTTTRPSPPWLITSQPSVWRSTVAPAPKNPVQPQQNERKKPTVITPPTFRPHITLPPEVRLGDVGTKKTTTRQPDTSSEREPPPSVKDIIEIAKDDLPKLLEPEIPKQEKPVKEEDTSVVVTEESMQWPVKDEDSDSMAPVQPPKDDRPADTVIVDDFVGSYTTIPTPNLGRRSYCPQINARGLHWNWTLAGSYAVQPCPGGATGLARWKCTLSQHHFSEDERPRRRATSLPSGENFHDLGLDQPSDRQLQLIRRLGSEALLKGRDGDSAELIKEYQYGLKEALPTGLSPHDSDYIYSDAVPEWHGATPDLSGCRSVWLNRLEAQVREGESLLSISNDLAQVTSSKTLYGGDMTTTATIMKKLAQRMSESIQTPDARHREAMVTDMLLGVIRTGSNLLEESQRASWADLSREGQNRVASELLTQLEENAFLLANAVTKEKTILQIVKNICLSVRVLEVKKVEDETFPSQIAQEQWKGSEDSITIPKAALLDNRQKDLVRIVFFAFDRLEEILPPTFGKTPHFAPYQADLASSSTTSINSEREKNNATKILNSKVISASLGNGRHIQLSQMVHITMKHLRTENVTNPACVFWDYTLHGWSPEGCHVEWSNETHTGCACSHLTNFAILMDVHGVALSPAHQLALQTITYIGCGISTVALGAAMFVFMCFRNGKSDRALIHKNLCACLLIAEIVFLVGIDQTQNPISCGIIAGLLHYFFLAAFAWMFLEGFHLYAMLVEVFEPEHPRSRWYCCCAYLAPAIVVAVSAAVYPSGYGTARHCWLSTERMFVMSFVGPVALVLLANWFCLGMVIYMMCTHSTVSLKAKDDAKIYKIRVWLNSSLVLAFLLGLTWTFGLLYLSEQTVVMAYVFTILNSLQGLVIFIFQCLQNDKFRNELARIGRRHPWLSCCLHFTGQPSETLAPPPASSTNHLDNRQPSVKSRRYHQSQDVDDVVDPRDVTNTSSKHHPGNSSTLPHHDTLSRQLAQQNHLSPYECDQPIAPGSPRHGIKDEESPLHHQGYQTTRSYNHDFRNPHVYMSQQSPGSQEMIFRKHYKDERRKHHHHHGSQNINHTYSEIASQQGRIYRRGSEEFRVIQDDPVYEEIERNETLMSDVSDDNSGPDNCRQPPGHHGSSSSKFFGDHRPLISYSPGERHHQEEHYGKYGKWDTMERYDPRHYESGRLMYHQPQENNMRALAAVLNGENNVVCHLEPHNSYEGYPQQSGNPRTVSQPSF